MLERQGQGMAANEPARARSLTTAPGERRYCRSERALWRLTTRGMVVLPPHGRPLAVTGAAVPLWELLADSVPAAELSVRLAARYHLTAQEVAEVIAPVLEDLVAAGAVVVEP